MPKGELQKYFMMETHDPLDIQVEKECLLLYPKLIISQRWMMT